MNQPFMDEVGSTPCVPQVVLAVKSNITVVSSRLVALVEPWLSRYTYRRFTTLPYGYWLCSGCSRSPGPIARYTCMLGAGTSAGPKRNLRPSPWALVYATL